MTPEGREGAHTALKTHDLYTDADKDRPDVICDRNGQVVLGLCKRCGRAEVELSTTCPGYTDYSPLGHMQVVVGGKVEQRPVERVEELPYEDLRGAHRVSVRSVPVHSDTEAVVHMINGEVHIVAVDK